jgi:hypothetical protein
MPEAAVLVNGDALFGPPVRRDPGKGGDRITRRADPLVHSLKTRHGFRKCVTEPIQDLKLELDRSRVCRAPPDKIPRPILFQRSGEIGE